ncbi:MAG TPA: PGPGW domain-containing protein [Actinomycetota bacterium]|jgi:uncharacterized protein (TIGR02611 family)|nr:PGPGW domain-containing protein [Actinomycetota bacterium]
MGGTERSSAWVVRNGRRVGVTVVGGILVAVGVLLLALPGPGLLLIAAGLAVLATEYRWARRALRRTRELARSAKDRSGEAARRGSG